jgi:hypothetical protein
MAWLPTPVSTGSRCASPGARQERSRHGTRRHSDRQRSDLALAECAPDRQHRLTRAPVSTSTPRINTDLRPASARHSPTASQPSARASRPRGRSLRLDWAGQCARARWRRWARHGFGRRRTARACAFVKWPATSWLLRSTGSARRQELSRQQHRGQIPLPPARTSRWGAGDR